MINFLSKQKQNDKMITKIADRILFYKQAINININQTTLIYHN